MRKLTREEFEARTRAELRGTLLMLTCHFSDYAVERFMEELIADGWTPPRYEEDEE